MSAAPLITELKRQHWSACERRGWEEGLRWAGGDQGPRWSRREAQEVLLLREGGQRALTGVLHAVSHCLLSIVSRKKKVL